MSQPLDRGEDLGFVHRFVPGSRGRTLLLLHGTGGDENDLLPLGKELAPDANLLSPRGQVLENGMPRFFRRLALGVFDVEDLQQRTHDLARFVRRACEVYDLDRSSLVALGYSNGANIAASLLLLDPKLFRRAVLLHAMVPFRPAPLPDLSSSEVLVTGGQQDSMIPPGKTQELASLLSEAGADVSLELHPGGHELTLPELDAVRRWL